MRLAGFTYDICLPDFCFCNDRAPNKISPWCRESGGRLDCHLGKKLLCTTNKLCLQNSVKYSGYWGIPPPHFRPLSFLLSLVLIPDQLYLEGSSFLLRDVKAGNVSWKSLRVFFWQFSHIQNRTLLGSVINIGTVESASNHVLFRSVNGFSFFQVSEFKSLSWGFTGTGRCLRSYCQIY